MGKLSYQSNNAACIGFPFYPCNSFLHHFRGTIPDVKYLGDFWHFRGVTSNRNEDPYPGTFPSTRLDFQFATE